MYNALGSSKLQLYESSEKWTEKKKRGCFGFEIYRLKKKKKRVEKNISTFVDIVI